MHQLRQQELHEAELHVCTLSQRPGDRGSSLERAVGRARTLLGEGLLKLVVEGARPLREPSTGAVAAAVDRNS